MYKGPEFGAKTPRQLEAERRSQLVKAALDSGRLVSPFASAEDLIMGGSSMLSDTLMRHGQVPPSPPPKPTANEAFYKEIAELPPEA